MFKLIDKSGNQVPRVIFRCANTNGESKCCDTSCPTHLWNRSEYFIPDYERENFESLIYPCEFIILLEPNEIDVFKNKDYKKWAILNLQHNNLHRKQIAMLICKNQIAE